MATKKATKQKQTLKSETLADLNDLRQLVKKAIDDGATNVEQVHQAIARMPYKYLEKIEKVYQLLRNINDKAADFTEEILKKVQGK